jgi:hypothetical protein
MSVSKKWVKENKDQVLELYRSRENYTATEIAAMLGATVDNVWGVLRQHMPAPEYAALKSIKYSKSRQGSKNPAYGKKREDNPRWKGACDDGYGYLTILWKGKRCFVHHVVVMEALGVSKLPKGLEVHHIDGNRKNNDLENLALVTRKGHQKIHFLQVKDSRALSSRKFKLAEALKYMT